MEIKVVTICGSMKFAKEMIKISSDARFMEHRFCYYSLRKNKKA